MTVAANMPAQVSYQGNDTTNIYDFPFRAELLSDLQISVIEDLTGDQQTFLGDVSPRFTAEWLTWPLDGGSVTLEPFTPDPEDLDYLNIDGTLKSGFSLIIAYVAEARQPTLFQNTNNMTPVQVAKQLDRMTMALKATIVLANQALRLQSGDGSSPVFPPLIGNENRGVYVNATADGFAYGPTVNEIQAQVDAAAQSASDAAQSASDAADQVVLATAQVALAQAAASDAQDQVVLATQAVVDAVAAKDLAEQAVVDAADQVALATTQANNAAQSAIDSEIAANRTLFQFIVDLSFGDSPFNITNADKNTLFRVDTTGGDVTLNLPLMSTVDPDFKVGVVKVADTNQVTVARDIGNTINGGGDVIITENSFGLVVWPVFPGSDWLARYFILESAAGGGAGSGKFTFAAEQLLAAGGQIIPIASTQQWLPIKSTGGIVTLDTNLFFNAPDDGTTIVVEGTDDTDYCIVPVSDTNGGFIGNGDLFLRKGVNATIVYDETNLRYKEIGRNGL